MRRRVLDLWQCWAAFLCLLGALAAAAQWLSMAATIGDAQFLPEGVCNAACRAGWNWKGKQADRWAYLAIALVLTTIGLTGWARRIGSRRISQ